MDHFQGITAEIISNGQLLKSYNDPDAAEIEDSHARHQYVEALAGSTFEVKVRLTPQFRFYGMKAEHAVKVWVTADGHDTCLSTTHTRKFLQSKFYQGRPVAFIFSGPSYLCKETAQWMTADYSFGNLVTKEIPDPRLSVKQAKKLGTIEIMVRRVILKKGKVRKTLDYPDIKQIDEVPEKALKGRPIDTTVRLANARPTSRPPLPTEISTGIGGEWGKPVVFKIHYRSRRALQMLGCIPRSPSPAIEVSNDEPAESIIRPESNPPTTDSSNNQLHNSMTSSASSSDEMLRQIQTLTARITELERAKIKTEAADPGAVIKNEAMSVKREREEDDSQNDPRQRRRTAVKIEHVDLTDD